ncbi:MAG: sugar phosphate isomerase/epimerase [Phycisphaeraceae bacterium]|nr:MAG: sugar phosphate isomerase/epimerase [Phycisphaeraceae bacterium]
MESCSRREFIAMGLAGAAVMTLPALGNPAKEQPVFTISLAEWSLHRALYAGDLDHLDFPKAARETCGIDAVEYVSVFFAKKDEDDYLAELNQHCRDHGVKSLLIMVDNEGAIGARDEGERLKTVENHRKWLHAAKVLGCHSIRVNAQSEGTYEEQQKLAADGLARLVAHAEPMGLNVIVENHGGLSSNGAWLAGVMKLVDNPRCGTLPDFGNFCLDWAKAEDPAMWYDRYKGVAEMMPYAKAVSAKSREFNDKGEEVQTDFHKMLRIVTDAGYHAHLGIEWEGDGMSEHDGIVATKKLLEKVREELV